MGPAHESQDSTQECTQEVDLSSLLNGILKMISKLLKYRECYEEEDWEQQALKKKQRTRIWNLLLHITHSFMRNAWYQDSLLFSMFRPTGLGLYWRITLKVHEKKLNNVKLSAWNILVLHSSGSMVSFLIGLFYIATQWK